MSPTRRQALAQLAALAALPYALPSARWSWEADDPLDGTIASTRRAAVAARGAR